jgi:predicted amidophosphoribosyltransferase
MYLHPRLPCLGSPSLTLHLLISTACGSHLPRIAPSCPHRGTEVRESATHPHRAQGQAKHPRGAENGLTMMA